jgi:hypothetical protein
MRDTKSASSFQGEANPRSGIRHVFRRVLVDGM